MISSEALLLLIVTLIVSFSIGVGLISVSEDISDVFTMTGEEVSEDFDEDIKIVGDLGSDVTYDTETGDLLLYVQNTGDSVIDTEDVLLFVEGDLVDSDVSIVDDSSRWYSGDVIRIDSNIDIDDDSARVRVQTPRSKDTDIIRTGD